MICPVQIARDMSALRAAKVGDHGKHGFLPEGRDGAGNESTGRDVASDGEEDHLVAGGGDPWDQRPAHAALARALRRTGLQRVVRPAAGAAVATAGTGGDGGEGVRAVPGEVFRSERAAFSRETAGRARDRTELHLGEAGVAGSGVSGARAQAWSASQTARAAAVAGDAVAYRRQPPPVVSGRTLVRPDRDSGRRHQRDFLRATGGRGIDGDGDGGAAGSHRAQGRVLRAVQRSRQPFLADSEGRRQGGWASSDPGGTGAARVGCADDSGLLAASSGAQRAQLLDLAGTIAAGTKTAQDRQPGSRQCISTRTLYRRIQPAFPSPSGAEGECFFGLSRTRSRSGVLPPVRAGSEPRQHGQLSESEPTNRSRALASHAGVLPGHGASALGWNSQPHPRPALTGTLHGRRGGAERDKNAGATGCGKAASWKSHKPDFPTSLGNPANCAGFPLSHSPDRCWLTMKPDISRATKTGHFNLLPTGCVSKGRFVGQLRIRSKKGAMRPLWDT